MHDHLHHPQEGGHDQKNLGEYNTGEMASLYDPADFENIVTSELWQNLSPNAPSPNDLLPKELNAAQLAMIGNTFLEPSFATDPGLWSGLGDLPADREIAGVGALEKVGSGETKACYRLTTEQGKKMAVLLMNYGNTLGLYTPEDPKLSQVSESPTRRLWEYSDLRTYLYIPLGDGRTVKLQEFGEEEFTSGQSMTPGLLWIAGRRALKNIASRQKSFIQLDTHTKPELSHARHYLRKDGQFMPVVIDLPVVEQVDKA